MSKRKAYCDGDEGQEKRARGIISIDLTKEDDRSQIYTPKSETNDDNDNAEFSSDQESFEDKEENYQSPLDKDLPNLVYYRGDKKLPIYSCTSPNLKRIFQICLKKDIPADRMAEIKPTSISSTSTFVVDQKFAKVKHPFDVEADETLGAYEKKEQTRFYEVKVNDEGELLISSEVSVNKDSKGIVVGGTYNTRDGRNWVKQVANKKIYML